MKTTYQKKHRPYKTVENKCSGKVVHGECTICGRMVVTNRPHLPNIIGAYGYVEFYSDGSTHNTVEV